MIRLKHRSEQRKLRPYHHIFTPDVLKMERQTWNVEKPRLSTFRRLVRVLTIRAVSLEWDSNKASLKIRLKPPFQSSANRTKFTTSWNRTRSTKAKLGWCVPVLFRVSTVKLCYRFLSNIVDSKVGSRNFQLTPYFCPCTGAKSDDWNSICSRRLQLFGL